MHWLRLVSLHLHLLTLSWAQRGDKVGAELLAEEMVRRCDRGSLA